MYIDKMLESCQRGRDQDETVGTEKDCLHLKLIKVDEILK